MEVQKIEGNCSMISIRDNPHSGTSKRQFLNMLYHAIVRYNNRVKASTHYIGGYIELDNIKCVMLTTNHRFYLWPFLNRGFSYAGNSHSDARVKFIRFPKGLKRTLTNEGII